MTTTETHLESIKPGDTIALTVGNLTVGKITRTRRSLNFHGRLDAGGLNMSISIPVDAITTTSSLPVVNQVQDYGTTKGKRTVRDFRYDRTTGLIVTDLERRVAIAAAQRAIDAGGTVQDATDRACEEAFAGFNRPWPRAHIVIHSDGAA